MNENLFSDHRPEADRPERTLTESQLRRWHDVLTNGTSLDRWLLERELNRSKPQDETDNSNKFSTRLYDDDLAAFCAIKDVYDTTTASILRDAFRFAVRNDFYARHYTLRPSTKPTNERD